MKKLGIVFFVLSVPALARPAEFFCSNVTCLIAAIDGANIEAGADTINLEPGTYTLTSIDNLPPFAANGLPVVTSEITINGVGGFTTSIERDPGAPGFRILDVAANGKLTLNGVTVRGGTSNSGSGISNKGILNINSSIIEANLPILGSRGGGIFNDNGGSLNLTHSIVMGNLFAFDGGGIYNNGTAVIINSSIIENLATAGGGVFNGGTALIENSTISHNTGDGGGGIRNTGIMEIKNTTVANNFIRFFEGAGVVNSGTVKITNSTISGNRAGASAQTSPATGGGIFNREGSILELQNSIVAVNSNISARPTPSPDCAGPITSLGNNIIGDLTGCDVSLAAGDLVTDPRLGDFVDDETPGGGHFPLLTNSPAIDKGNDEVCSADPVSDQLGQSRVGPCDIGAIEFQGPVSVAIDVRPRVDPNKINPSSIKSINVAILSLNGFDATVIDLNTVRFGASGSEAAPVHVGRRDVNGDGQRDLVLRFQIQDLRIECGATSVTLTGQLLDGHLIVGSSPIITTGCKQTRASKL